LSERRVRRELFKLAARWSRCTQRSYSSRAPRLWEPVPPATGLAMRLPQVDRR